MTASTHPPHTPSRLNQPQLLTLLTWLWLFLPLLWMWPNLRSLSEVTLSALLLMGLLLSRTTTRLAVVLLWAIGVGFLGYFFAVHSLPDEFFWQSILGSNTSEALEFIQSYRSLDMLLLLAWALPALAAARHLWRSPRPLQSKLLRVLAWVLVALWAAWAAVSVAKNYDVYRAFSRVARVYPLMMVESWGRYVDNAQFSSQPVTVAAPQQAPMVDVLVVVLGESASAHRWSLLGYGDRPTNAALAPWQSGLVTLPVTTNGNNTGMTLPVILAGRSLHPLPAEGVASYLDYTRTAGFDNHVFANQQAPGFANAALRLRSDRHLQLQDGQFDGALTALLQESLREHAQQGTPLVITLHTYGSHPRVTKRYPESAALWDDPYDNSLHYTSELLAQWIQALEQLPQARTALLYVSDHGQDLPSCGGSYTHGSTRSTYEVPLLLWASQPLRQQYPTWWQQWQQLAQHAVDAQGIPRFNTLLAAQAIEQLAGYPGSLPSVETASSPGAYPPAPTSICSDWAPQVQQLHPAAIK